jgi:hypothetical protein
MKFPFQHLGFVFLIFLVGCAAQPDRVHALSVRADMNAKLGKYQDALTDYRKLSGIKKTPEVKMMACMLEERVSGTPPMFCYREVIAMYQQSDADDLTKSNVVLAMCFADDPGAAQANERYFGEQSSLPMPPEMRAFMKETFENFDRKKYLDEIMP